MTEDRIFEIAELLADEVYKENGVVMYAERQELTSKFNKILVENLAIHDVVKSFYCDWEDSEIVGRCQKQCKICKTLDSD